MTPQIAQMCWNQYIELLEMQIKVTTQILELCTFPEPHEIKERPTYIRLATVDGRQIDRR